MQTETLALHALTHLEKCFEQAYDKKIVCPSCGKRIVDDVVQHAAPFPDGVLVFSTCGRCADRMKKGPIRRTASPRLMPLAPAVFIETPAPKAQLEAVKAWIGMEGE